MRRFPIPLILAAIIAVGMTVTIIFQVIVLNTPSAVVVLVPQGSPGAAFYIEGQGTQYVAFPIGMGLMQITFNTTDFYYYNLTELWSLAVPSHKYTNMTGTHAVNTGARIQNIHVFDCGNVVVVGHAFMVYVGQWTDFGGHKVTVPVNFTASQAQLSCIRNYLYYFNLVDVDVYSPRLDYYVFDGDRIYIYYDLVTRATHIFRYDRRAFTPTRVTTSGPLVLGYKITDSQTGVTYLGGYYVGAFSAAQSGTYVVTVTGR